MIQKFITSLTENQKKLLFATLAVVFVALFDRLLIGPTVSKLSSIDLEIVKEESAIRQDLHFLDYKDKVVKEGKLLERYLTKKVLAEEELVSLFLREIEDLANQAKVTLVKVTPAAGLEEKDYMKYQADLECTGKLESIVSYMQLINSSKSLLKVTQFNLGGSKKTDTDEVKATMTISKIVVASAKAAVNAVASPVTAPSTDNSAVSE